MPVPKRIESLRAALSGALALSSLADPSSPGVFNPGTDSTNSGRPTLFLPGARTGLALPNLGLGTRNSGVCGCGRARYIWNNRILCEL